MPAPYVLVPAGTFAGRAAGELVDLPPAAVHHLTRVLRLRDGATVTASDGAGVVVEGEVRGGGLSLSSAPAAVAPPSPRLVVWQALGKGRKHDEVVRVLTELGVDEVVAVTSERTVVQLDGKADRVRTRWRSVAAAACEQARRPRLPRIAGPVEVADLVTGLDGTPCVVAHVGETTDPLTAVRSIDGHDEVVVAVGPEGGWTDDEMASFVAAGATPVGLGPTVLRTEHAATVLAAIVLAATGRMTG